MRHVRRKVGQEASEILLDTLSLASESVDSLLDLMESLRAAIAEGLVDAVSAHGVFLRQICLGFEELSFESITFLWEELIDQLNRSKLLFEVDDGEDDDSEVMMDDDYVGNSIHNDLSFLALDAFSETWPLSTEQVDALLRKTCFEMQEKAIPLQSFEAVEVHIRSVLDKDPEVPSAYFLRFLNCLRYGERVGALDALHQFFDHAMVKNTAPKEILQFSAILQAIAHSSFGDHGFALMATEESVRVAQQSKDAACVAFALGWLYENEGHGTSERRELLKRCATRAAQGQIRPLVAGSSLRLAMNYLEDENRNPTFTWTSLMEATSEPTNDSLPSLDRPTFLTPSPRQTMKSLARQSLVTAGVWNSLGIPALARMSSLFSLKLHKNLSATERLSLFQNILLLIPYSNAAKLPSHDTLYSRPSEPNSNILTMFQTQCFDDQQFYDSFSPSLITALHEVSVNEGDLPAAEALETVFDSSLRAGLASRYQYMADMGLQKCRCYCRKQDYEGARRLSISLLRMIEERNLKCCRPRILIEIASIELEASPNQLFMSAMSPILEALAICEKSRMYGLHAMALSVLARIFVRLQNPKRAVAILKAAIPLLLQREHVWHSADAYLTNAKCYVQFADNCRNTVKKSNYFRAASKGLASSASMFEKCHDSTRLQEVYYLQARVFSELRQTKEREKASQRFLMLRQNSKLRRKPHVLKSLGNPATITRIAARV